MNGVFKIIKFDLLRKVFLFSIILLFASVSLFSFDMSTIENAWKDRGYSIVEKEGMKIVEFSFTYESVATINPAAKEFFIVSYIKTPKEKPDSPYISDVKKVLLNSSLTETLTNELVNNLTDAQKWGKLFRVADAYDVESILYDSTTVVLRVKINPKQPTLSETTPTDIKEKDALSLAQIKTLTDQNALLREEIARLKVEKQALINKNGLLEKINQNQLEELEKYKGLSEYRNDIIINLKNTTDRYIKIEEQHKMQIEKLEAQMGQLHSQHLAAQNKQKEIMRALEHEIETLENDRKKLTNENNILKDTQDYYLQRLDHMALVYKASVSSQVSQDLSPTSTESSQEVPHEKTGTLVEAPLHSEVETIPEIQGEEIQLEKSEPPVKRIKTVNFYNKQTLSHKIENHYNDENKLIKEIVILPDGSNPAYTEYEYDKDGKIEEKLSYRNGTLFSRGVFHYDEDEKLKRTFFYDKDSLKSYSVYEYDETVSDEEPVKIKNFEENKLSNTLENEFNEKGQVYKTYNKDPQGNILSYTVFEYENESVKKATFFQKSKIMGYQINEYDITNNLTLQKNYNDNELISKIELVWEQTH